MALTRDQARSTPGSVNVRFEEDENDHAGDRYVQPNRKRQAGDSAVHCEPARQREKERRQHHRQRDDREDHVTDQNGKVQTAHRAVSGKDRVAVQSMVHDVADEKNRREGEGQQHACAMGSPTVMFDEIQSHAECNRTQSVQKSVEGRQKHPAPGKIS